MISQRVPLGKRKLDYFYFAYFLLHIPITLLIDISLALPDLTPLHTFLLDFHIKSNKDLLNANPPNWLVVFVFMEILFQLPFFFWGAYRLYTVKRIPNSVEDAPDHMDQNANGKLYLWILIYGLNASITTLGCIAEIFKFGPSQLNLLSNDDVTKLVSVYLPTFLIPFGMAVDMVLRISSIFKYNESLKLKTN
ncbi:hypothetical protein NADFUDRAFT_62177 [Nadsonia fulvescens var. elongata DSM 6958]|uniref:Efficient mitochondria targeting-associated protein 19 n=1 Tax=Nadsonia fulvescens var. elongata DSM 6958 TaxID=857566 RepID=A0A1E3PDY8_9ASCO|nr:hypothetical protein NADFUDRAFT_62177 [Nadsonia fulvescens var. elongata DSM 6958]